MKAVTSVVRRRSITTTLTFQCASCGTSGSARRFTTGPRNRRLIGSPILLTCRSTSLISSCMTSTAPNCPGNSTLPIRTIGSNIIKIMTESAPIYSGRVLEASYKLKSLFFIYYYRYYYRIYLYNVLPMFCQCLAQFSKLFWGLFTHPSVGV